MAFGPGAADQDYCYLTTTGRTSGKPREIEIWFALTLEPDAAGRAPLFMLSGGGERSHWVQNVQREPAVTVRIDGVTHPGRARIVTDPDEDALARRLVFDKYSARYGGDLENWRRTALPVAVDLGG